MPYTFIDSNKLLHLFLFMYTAISPNDIRSYGELARHHPRKRLILYLETVTISQRDVKPTRDVYKVARVRRSWDESRDKRCKGPWKGGKEGTGLPLAAARFSRRLPAPPRAPGARRKNAFPNGREIYGARTMAPDVPDKATRFTLALPPPRSPSVSLPSRAIPMYRASPSLTHVHRPR